MQLKHRDGTLMSREELGRSETIPKICIIGAPQHGGNLAVRYFTPQTAHGSLAVSGGCCLAAAALIEGTVAHDLAQDITHANTTPADIRIALENPAGILDTTVVAQHTKDGLNIASAAYRKNAQILLRGHVPLYRASAELIAAIMENAG